MLKTKQYQYSKNLSACNPLKHTHISLRHPQINTQAFFYKRYKYVNMQASKNQIYKTVTMKSM